MLIEKLNSDFERNYYVYQSQEIIELAIRPYVIETDLWSIQAYRHNKAVDWEYIPNHIRLEFMELIETLSKPHPKTG